MGKKVKIPIKGVNDEETGAEDSFDEVSESALESEEALHGAQEEDSPESSSDEEDSDDFNGLDSGFSDRDVDFSDFEEEDVVQSADVGETGYKEELEKARAESLDLKQKYLRALADLDNFRKRAQKEKSDLLKYQGEKIIVDIVDVLDNLELALQHKDAEIENLRTGVEMIHQQFIDVLNRWGIKSESALGSQFDPNKQNAINKVPTADAEPGSVIAELKKAYYYKDKLLRVANVVVADAVQDTEKTEENTPAD